MRVGDIQEALAAGLSRLTALGVVLGLAAACGAVAAPGADAGPTASAQQISITGWLNPGEPVVAANGDLWLTAQRAAPSGGLQTELLEVAPSGRVLRTIDRDLTPLLIGSDGNLWFATTGADARLGSISPAGRIRVFSPLLTPEDAPAAPQVALDGATVGPNGDVWFAVHGNGEVHAKVGYITPAGHVTTVPGLSHSGSAWSGIATDTHGDIWLAGLDQLTWRSPDGSISTLTGISPRGPLAPDLQGNVWAPGAYDAKVYELRSGTSGHPAKVRTTTWTGAGLTTEYSPPMAVATAADGRPWLLGAPCTAIGALDDGCSSYGNLQLGSISSGQAITTDSAPISSQAFPAPQLTAGPDGQLLTSLPTDDPIVNGAYQPTDDGALWAITLPDAPQMRSPSLRLLNAVQHPRRTDITLHCAGQAGRYCSGTIAQHAGRSARQVQRYAISPNHTTTYQITTRGDTRSTQLVVTNTALGGRTIQRLVTTVRAVR